MQKLLLVFLVCCVAVKGISVDSKNCYASSCKWPNIVKFASNYCEESKSFMDCLDENVLNNPDCTQSQKEVLDESISATKAARSLNHCSGGVKLTSSLVTCLVGLVYVLFNK
ncbi:unnamed protein product [Lymnaea stagnalis]|uniref:Uncharacterized protein n=1 Tax=Lymnaea stagnalis TaxID=6523 RepID=A0AAV2HFL5_LYMST